MGIHVVEKFRQLGLLQEAVVGFEIVVLHLDQPVGRNLPADIDVDEAIDRAGHCTVPFVCSSSCSARLSTLAVGVIGISASDSDTIQYVGTLNALSRSRVSATR